MGIDTTGMIACGCLGPQGGDPFCPCVMQSKGLRPAITWTPEREAEFDEALRRAIEEKKL